MSTGERVENRRHFSRIPMDIKITLACGAQQWESSLLDISLKGALLATPDNFIAPQNATCRVMFSLDASDLTIMMVGKVVHQKERHLGFRCDNIDLDSVTHLKRMVQLNLGDTALLERELGELIAVQE